MEDRRIHAEKPDGAGAEVPFSQHGVREPLELAQPEALEGQKAPCCCRPSQPESHQLSHGVRPRPPSSALVEADSARQKDRMHLTPRQSEIIALVASGLSDKEIALRLGLSNRTVRTHLERLYQEYRLHNRAEAVAAWYGKLIG